jgi:hypothetical protein
MRREKNKSDEKKISGEKNMAKVLCLLGTSGQRNQ